MGDQNDDTLLGTELFLANPRQNGFAQLFVPVNSPVLGVETAFFFYKPDVRKSLHDPVPKMEYAEPIEIDRTICACSPPDRAPKQINPTINTDSDIIRSPNLGVDEAIGNHESSSEPADIIKVTKGASPRHNQGCRQRNLTNLDSGSIEHLQVETTIVNTGIGQRRDRIGLFEVRNGKSNSNRSLYKLETVSKAHPEASRNQKFNVKGAMVNSGQHLNSPLNHSQNAKRSECQEGVPSPVSHAIQKKKPRTSKYKARKNETVLYSGRPRTRHPPSSRIGPVVAPHHVPHKITPESVLWKIHYQGLLKRVTPLHCHHRDDDSYRIRWQTQYAQNQKHQYVRDPLYCRSQNCRRAFIRAQKSRAAKEKHEAKRRCALQRKQRRRLYRLVYLQFKKGRVEWLTEMGKLRKAYAMGWTAHREWRYWRMLLKDTRNRMRRRKRRKRIQTLDFDWIQQHAEGRIYEMRVNRKIKGNFPEKVL